ncbi:MAG: hypothetical protein AAGF47_01345 [Planctomycetota bacterium]
MPDLGHMKGTHMLIRKENKTTADRTRRLPAALMTACGLCLGIAAAPATANAQYSDENEYKEWSEDEGIHEEEWYDPSDWFDDDFDGIDIADTDYEYDYDYYDDDTYALYDDEEYDSSWWNDADQTLYVDSYHDGYYDGYDGYDSVYNDWSSDDDSNTSADDRRHEGYSSGYSDGQNDKRNGMSSNWTYYIFTMPVSNENRSDQQKRQANSDRKRGDRANEARTAGLDKNQCKQMAHGTNMQRIRGTVASVEQFKKERLGQQMKDHTVLRLTMDDGKTIVCDLGPNAGKGVISEGDRVTIKGERVDRGGRTIFDAARLSVNDEILWNTQGKGEPTKISQR